MRGRHILVGLLSIVGAQRLARAQSVGSFTGLNITTDSSSFNQTDTPGVRVSDSLLLHSALAVGAGVDSNVFYQDSNATSAAVTHIMPSFLLTNEGRGAEPNIAGRLFLNGDYRQYYSDNDFVKNEGSAFGLGVGAILDIGTQTQWTGTLFNNFIRDVQASYLPGTNEFDRDIEQAGARLRWRPGGGRLEEFLTYTFMYDHFESDELSLADSISNGITFRSAFKFLPKTSVFLQVDQQFVHYLHDNVGKVNSDPTHIELGLVGLVTPRLTVNLAAGYAKGNYDTGPDPSTIAALAELGFIVGPFARAKVGYQHDFVNSLYGNFYDLDAAYASWIQQVGHSFMADMGFRWEHRTYHCDQALMATPIACFQDINGSDRVDNWVVLNLDANYFPRPWFSAGVAYKLFANVSDFELMSATAGGGGPIKVSFVKHQVMGVISANY